MSAAEGFVQFLRKTPTQFHVVNECMKQLSAAGFTRLSEKENWENKVKPNGRYFYTRNETSLFAFAVGPQFQKGDGFAIVAAHTDSPSLKLKPISKQEKDGHMMMGVEVYGGGKFYTWTDRDLAVAGRVICERDGRIESKIFDIHKSLCFIPSLAIHLSDEKERTGDKISFNKETQLVPIIGLKDTEDLSEDEKKKLKEEEKACPIYKNHHKELVELICSQTGVEAKDILDMDVYLYDMNQATLGGLHDEFVFSGKIDNLSMTYCGLTGFIHSLEKPVDNDHMVRVLALFDHEEIGSNSLCGAEGNSLSCLISSLSGPDCMSQAIRKSFLLSYDVAHAYNPEYSDKYETQHHCLLNRGITMSYAANQNMATSSPSASVMRLLCKKYALPLQVSVKKQNMREGSTVGPHISAQLGILTADLGIPQLAMHSIREMGGSKDIETGVKLAEVFYREWGGIEPMMKLGEEYYFCLFNSLRMWLFLFTTSCVQQTRELVPYKSLIMGGNA